MKPSTPRKSRRRNQPPNGAGPSDIIPISDYESDAPDAQMLATLASSATAVESNIQATKIIEGFSRIGPMNLSVLQRYQPSIQSCNPGPPTTVYFWDKESEGWGEPSGVGPLFVCDQHPDLSTGQPVPRPCIFILNRKGLDNFFFDLAAVRGLHISDHPSAHGRKAMIQISLIDPAQPDLDGDHLWGLVGDAEPMEGAYEEMQRKMNEMNAASAIFQ